jgi:pimeloyl-CoA synthetase
MIFLLSLFTLLQFNAVNAIDNDLSGKWINEDKTRVLEFTQNSGIYEAIIVKAEDNALIGKKQITGLKKEGTNYKGTLHVIRKNKDMDCIVTIINNNTIEIKGSYGFISKAQKWYRQKQ